MESDIKAIEKSSKEIRETNASELKFFPNKRFLELLEKTRILNILERQYTNHI